MSNYHSNYHDYLMHKTAQKNSLRNFIDDPNFNMKFNLPLYMNYQLKLLRNECNIENKNTNYHVIHKKISEKIEKINQITQTKVKYNYNLQKYQNFLTPKQKNIDDKIKENNAFLRSIFKKLNEKLHNNHQIEKNFLFETPAEILHKKNEKKEKLTTDTNLKLLMHENLNEDELAELWRKFSIVLLRKKLEEQKIKSARENKKNEDFLQFKIDKGKILEDRSGFLTIRELCKKDKIGITKVLNLPPGLFFIFINFF